MTKSKMKEAQKSNIILYQFFKNKNQRESWGNSLVHMCLLYKHKDLSSPTPCKKLGTVAGACDLIVRELLAGYLRL